LGKVTQQIGKDAELRLLLEKHHGLSETQEYLLEYYLDGKITIHTVHELMPFVFDKTALDQIVALIQTGQTPNESEAIVWLNEHGFGELIKLEELKDDEKPRVNRRVTNRIIMLKKIAEELGCNEATVSDFLEIVRNHQDFKAWQVLYGWNSWSNNPGLHDESTRIILVGFRLYCQHGVEYLKAAMELTEFASKMGLGINFGSYLDYFVLMAEAKIAPQTIFDLFAVVRGLPIPTEDALSYQQAFGDKVDEVIQYWIKHHRKVVNGLGHPRDSDDDNYLSFLWCTSNSIEAANYVLETMSMRDEAVWAKLMKAFVAAYQQPRDTALVKSLFEWLFSITPKTCIKCVPGVIGKITSHGMDYARAFISEAGNSPKKELAFTLCHKNAIDVMRFMYIDELGEDVFSILFGTEDEYKRLKIDYYGFLICRNILNKCYDKNDMQKYLREEWHSLRSRPSFGFINSLAKKDCTLTVSMLEHVTMIKDKKFERINQNLAMINITLWPELIRLEATACPIAITRYSAREVEFLLKNKVTPAVALVANKNFRKEPNVDWLYPSPPNYEYINPIFKRLVELGLDCYELFRLCMSTGYINEELVRFWVEHSNDKTPMRELVQWTDWIYPNEHDRNLVYTKENCEMLMKIYNEHEQDIPIVLKALSLDFDFSQILKLVLAGELTDEKITEMLLKKSGLSGIVTKS